MSRLEHKIALVEKGHSKVFNNWNRLFGISQEEFIEGLKWLDKDPQDGKSQNNQFDAVTREIAIEANPEAWKHAQTLSMPAKYQKIYGDHFDNSKCEAHLIKLSRHYNRYDQLNFYRQDTGIIYNKLNKIVGLNVRDRI